MSALRPLPRLIKNNRIPNSKLCFMIVFTVTCLNLFYILAISQRSPPELFELQEVEIVVENDLQNYTQRFCSYTERQNVVFLKTHKCASTSIQNIFLRYGYRHQLKFVLPAQNNYLGHPTRFNRRFVPPGNYNILTHHTRFNRIEMKQLMPQDTLYITILRHPVQLFESMYNYYNLDKFYKFPFEQFNNDSAILPDFSKRYVGKIGTNQMFFDLGYSVHDNTPKIIQAYIDQIENSFDLIMIEEYLDESLLFLKNLLCWTIDDVITFKMNARPRKKTMNEIARKRIEQLNAADLVLYEHFLKKFREQMKSYNEKLLQLELKYMQKRRKQMYQKCVEKEISPKNARQFNVVQLKSRPSKSVLCKLMTTTELELTEYIRERQKRLYPGIEDEQTTSMVFASIQSLKSSDRT